MKERLVFDTNIFVAAGFNPGSTSARLLKAVQAGEIEMVWNEATRRETRKIIDQIPPLSWERFESLFDLSEPFDEATHPEQFDFVEDRDDRKFAALASAANAAIITNDDHLLSVRDRLDVKVLTPGEWEKQQR